MGDPARGQHGHRWGATCSTRRVRCTRWPRPCTATCGASCTSSTGCWWRSRWTSRTRTATARTGRGRSGQGVRRHLLPQEEKGEAEAEAAVRRPGRRTRCHQQRRRRRHRRRRRRRRRGLGRRRARRGRRKRQRPPSHPSGCHRRRRRQCCHQRRRYGRQCRLRVRRQHQRRHRRLCCQRHHRSWSRDRRRSQHGRRSWHGQGGWPRRSWPRPPLARSSRTQGPRRPVAGPSQSRNGDAA